MSRERLILGKWLDNSSGQTRAKLNAPCWDMVMRFISHLYPPSIQLQTPNPSSAVGDLDASLSSASESIFLLCMQCPETSRMAGLQHSAIQAPLGSRAKSLRAQNDWITSKSGQVPVSPPDDRLAQGDTRHVRKCRQIISGQIRLKSCKSCKSLCFSSFSEANSKTVPWHWLIPVCTWPLCHQTAFIMTLIYFKSQNTIKRHFEAKHIYRAYYRKIINYY